MCTSSQSVASEAARVASRPGWRRLSGDLPHDLAATRPLTTAARAHHSVTRATCVDRRPPSAGASPDGGASRRGSRRRLSPAHGEERAQQEPLRMTRPAQELEVDVAPTARCRLHQVDPIAARDLLGGRGCSEGDLSVQGPSRRTSRSPGKVGRTARGRSHSGQSGVCPTAGPRSHRLTPRAIGGRHQYPMRRVPEMYWSTVRTGTKLRRWVREHRR